jgi:hypothetical protein
VITPTTVTPTSTTGVNTPATTTVIENQDVPPVVEPSIGIKGLRSGTTIDGVATATVTFKNFSVVPTVTYRLNQGPEIVITSPYEIVIQPTDIQIGKNSLYVTANSNDEQATRRVSFTYKNKINSDQKKFEQVIVWQTNSNVNLRVAPRGQIITVIPKNSVVQRTGKISTEADGTVWIEVKTTSGQTGFVHTNFLSVMTTGSTTATQNTVTVLQQRIIELQTLLNALLGKSRN